MKFDQKSEEKLRPQIPSTATDLMKVPTGDLKHSGDCRWVEAAVCRTGLSSDASPIEDHENEKYWAVHIEFGSRLQAFDDDVLKGAIHWISVLFRQWTHF